MGTPPDFDRARFERSVRRSVHRRVLLVHATVFAVVMAALIAINYLDRQNGANWWVLWPLIGWGGGLALHAVLTLVLNTGEPDA